MDEKKITVLATVNAPIEKVWEFWTRPEHIVKWAFASDDWEAPAAENDLRVGGRFKIVMAAKDKSVSFDFTGTYTEVKKCEVIAYEIDDSRHVRVDFGLRSNGVSITETFEIEKTNPAEKQRAGWQAIVDNFKKYTEA